MSRSRLVCHIWHLRPACIALSQVVGHIVGVEGDYQMGKRLVKQVGVMMGSTSFNL